MWTIRRTLAGRLCLLLGVLMISASAAVADGGLMMFCRTNRGSQWTSISEDGGETWSAVGDHVLLGHCAGDRRENNGLAETQITRFSLDWLYR